jgi:hypothetical protein
MLAKVSLLSLNGGRMLSLLVAIFMSFWLVPTTQAAPQIIQQPASVEVAAG